MTIPARTLVARSVSDANRHARTGLPSKFALNSTCCGTRARTLGVSFLGRNGQRTRKAKLTRRDQARSECISCRQRWQRDVRRERGGTLGMSLLPAMLATPCVPGTSRHAGSELSDSRAGNAESARSGGSREGHGRDTGGRPGQGTCR